MSLSLRKCTKYYESLSGISNLMLCIVGFLNPFQVLMSSAMLMAGMHKETMLMLSAYHVYNLTHQKPSLRIQAIAKQKRQEKNYMGFKRLTFTKFKS